MSFLRHEEIFRSDDPSPSSLGDGQAVGLSVAFFKVSEACGGLAPTHRLDESPAGYSLAGCAPAEPASASPAVHDSAIKEFCRSTDFQRTANSGLTGCLTFGSTPGEAVARASVVLGVPVLRRLGLREIGDDDDSGDPGGSEEDRPEATTALRVNPEPGRALKSHENTYLEELGDGRPVLVKSDQQLH
jgi:hypothetical protein